MVLLRGERQNAPTLTTYLLGPFKCIQKIQTLKVIQINFLAMRIAHRPFAATYFCDKVFSVPI